MSSATPRIKMLRDVKRPDRPNAHLVEGRVYTAGCSNALGAIWAVCDNGEILGVRPDEFEFVYTPDWVLEA